MFGDQKAVISLVLLGPSCDLFNSPVNKGKRINFKLINPGVANRTFGDRTQSDPITRLGLIGFGNRT